MSNPANSLYNWTPGRWWRVAAPDGSTWCETSDKQEAIESMRPGDKLYREWRQDNHKWVQVTTDPIHGPIEAET